MKTVPKWADDLSSPSNQSPGHNVAENRDKGPPKSGMIWYKCTKVGARFRKCHMLYQFSSIRAS